jgi:hypothetical protein
MRNKTISVVFLTLFVFCITLSANDNEWYIPDDIPEYVMNEDVGSIAVDKDNNIFFASAGNGLWKYDFHKWTGYYTANSDIPSNDVYGIYFDKNNNLWCETGWGIAKYDGGVWNVRNSNNSIMEDNTIMSSCLDSNGGLWISNFDGIYYFKDTIQTFFENTQWAESMLTDKNNNIWFGLAVGGMFKYDWNEFIYIDERNFIPVVYNPHYAVRAMTLDRNSDFWVTPNQGIAKYNSGKFILWDKKRTGIPTDYIYCIKADRDNNIWMGTDTGLVKFDGETFTTYSTDNSPIPSNYVYTIAIDSLNQKWVACATPWEKIVNTRIAVFREGGTVFTDVDDKDKEHGNNLFVYPNPASDKFYIDFHINTSLIYELSLYNSLGIRVKSIHKNMVQPGFISESIDVSDFPVGTYFIRLKINDRYISKKTFIIR